MNTRWKPHATVAAIIEDAGRFLLVEERDGERTVYNQPAGHLEPGESLRDAASREVREETGLRFTPTHLVGIYRWQRHADAPCFLRFCFAGDTRPDPLAQPRDPAILATHWKTRDELASLPLRSPLVLRCLDDYLAGHRYDLMLLHDLAPED